MANQSRLRELSARHRQLDETIEAEMKRPAADPCELAALKRRKLRLKEEIEGLKGRDAR